MAAGDPVQRSRDIECDRQFTARRPAPTQAVPDTVQGALWITELPVPSGALAGRSFLSDFDIRLADLRCAATPPFELRDQPVLYGGRLESADMVAPAVGKGHVLIFLPPLRADGLPEHDVNRVAAQLAQYRDAAAILVDALDLSPHRGTQMRLLAPAARPQCPPVVLISHAVARVLLSKPPELAAPGWNSCVRVTLKFKPAKSSR